MSHNEALTPNDVAGVMMTAFAFFAGPCEMGVSKAIGDSRGGVIAML